MKLFSYITNTLNIYLLLRMQSCECFFFSYFIETKKLTVYINVWHYALKVHAFDFTTLKRTYPRTIFWPWDTGLFAIFVLTTIGQALEAVPSQLLQHMFSSLFHIFQSDKD